VDIIIRKMEEKDIRQVHEIDKMSFSLPWPERSFRFELTENPSTRLWVAEAHKDDGSSEVVGLLVMWIIIDEGHIGTFAVHPDYRRLGIGRKLLARSLLEASKEGLVQVFLEVRRSNSAAIRLYEELDFKVDGIRARYYRDNGEDALLMRLERVDVEKLKKMV
jgi:[ribosomal protein S18]-alanine N-acetyltransferase